MKERKQQLFSEVLLIVLALVLALVVNSFSFSLVIINLTINCVHSNSDHYQAIFSKAFTLD